MGGMLVLHGGFNSDENYLYNKIEIFDMQYKKWTVGELKGPDAPKKKKYEEADPFEKRVDYPGYLQLHSMLMMKEDPYFDNNNRSLWYQQSN
jgi:hypothetical protein